MSEFFDIHTHVGEQINDLYDEPEVFPRKETIQELVEKYDERIEKIVTFPMPGTVFFNYDGSETIRSQTGKSSFPYQLENKALIESVDKYDKNNKIIPFACVDPKIMVSEQIEALDNLSQNNRLVGLKFHTLDTNCTVDDFFVNNEIVAFCKEKQIPIMIHSANFNNVENCNGIFRWANQYPDINMCVAHLMTFSETFFKQLSTYQGNNLFTDISPFLGLCQMIKQIPDIGPQLDLPYDSPNEVLSTLYKYFSKFLLWGSDEPFGKFKLSDEYYVNNTLEEELKFLFSLEPSIRERIAGENSRRYLNIKQSS